jgi:hypothetical protein
MKLSNARIYYHLIITIGFVYIFIQFLTMKRTNIIYKTYTDYIMNKYCLILYILLLLLVGRYDGYTAVLLFILVMIPFKCAYKEYYEDNDSNAIDVAVNIQPITTTMPTVSNLLNNETLDIDDRFKMDDISKNQILKQIKAQVEFDPYKTQLSKDVIFEIYNKYFDNDIFVKLKNTNDDSKEYIASGNFKYIPKESKVDYDLVSYQNLSNNTSFGVDLLTDGILNKTQS